MRYPWPEQFPDILRSLVMPALGLPTRGTPIRGKCAQCGASIVAPEWSEHLSQDRVRNVWACDLCGYQFEDMVYLSGTSAQK